MNTSRLTAVAAGAAAALVMGMGAQSASADALGSPVQVSDVGEHNDAQHPSVAWNPQTRQYLAVWRTDAALAQEISARFLDATGNPVGYAFAVSEPTHDVCTAETFVCSDTVNDPKVVYNATENEFFVVWWRTAGIPVFELAAQEVSAQAIRCSEVHGQRLSAAGAQLGTNDVVISTEQSPCAEDPDVSWSSVSNRYLVAWADRGEGSDIRGRLVGADGAPLPPGDELEISDALGNTARPDIAYDALRDRWMVVWDDGAEILRQLIDRDGSNVGANAPLSEPGQVSRPSVVFNATANEYLVVWDRSIVQEARIASAAPVDPQELVQAQRLNADGVELGSDDFRVSDTRFVDARVASVAWDSVGNRYALVYEAVEQNQREQVIGKMLDAAGALVGTSGFPVSTSEALNHGEPRALAYNRETCEFFAGWEGRVGANRGWEIHVRWLAATPCPQVTSDGTTPAVPAATPSGAPSVPAAAPDTARPQIAVLGVRAFGGSCSRGTTLRVRVRASDASRIAKIVVFVDGERVRRTTRTRFTVTISERGLRVGRHVVRIVARDAAGNRATRTVRFRRCAEQVVLPRFTG